MDISKNTLNEVLGNFKKRVIKILYLKDDVINEIIEQYDLDSYIDALNSDLYGAYKVFDNFKFINAMCELEGIKKNIDKNFARKKILDLANYIITIE